MVLHIIMKSLMLCPLEQARFGGTTYTIVLLTCVLTYVVHGVIVQSGLGVVIYSKALGYHQRQSKIYVVVAGLQDMTNTNRDIKQQTQLIVIKMPKHQILCGSVQLDLYPWEKTTGEIRYLKRRSQKDYNFNLTHSNLQNLHEISKKEKRRVYKSIQLNSLKLFLIFSLHPSPHCAFLQSLKNKLGVIHL